MVQKFELALRNIGPHKTLNFKKELKKIQIGIYARNGKGKTFISRAFRTFEIDNSRYHDYARKILNSESIHGSFKLRIGNSVDSYEVNSTIYNIQKNIDRKMYTFNSDYIYDNFTESHYNLNGNITGFILGKSNIDLSEDKIKLENLIKQGNNLKKDLDNKIEFQKSLLQSYGLDNRLKKYQEIDYEHLMSHTINNNVDYHKSIVQMRAINEINDEIDDIKKLYYNNLITNSFSKIKTLLESKYTLNEFEDKFKKHVKLHLKFIKDGLEQYDEEKKICPYCHQKLDDSALNLVHSYINYVNDQEAVIISEIDKWMQQLNSIIDYNNTFIDEFLVAYGEIKYKDIFGDISNEDIKDLKDEIHKIIDYLNELLDKLNEKKKDISIFIGCEAFDGFNKLNDTINIINMQIINYNTKKNKLTITKKDLKKRLCEGSLNELYLKNIETITEINTIRTQCKELKKEIQQKELQSKKSKKELVYNDFQKYLNQFFYGKYELDKDTFTLSLNSNRIKGNPDNVLSDGEKTILAFCYYLANIHSIVDSESDYEKVILIIDDPISSMDIDYIYQLVTIIKNYGIGMEMKFEKYIILTHNLDFYSLLVNNKITNTNLYLNSGAIKPYKDDLLMPYEFHLKDIYDIANENKSPTYTTANSIRHILETICQFEGYPKNSDSLQRMINDSIEFKEVRGVSSYMQDLSHGNVRFEMVQNQEMIINCCKAVIAFIKTKYPMQINKYTHSDR